MKSKETVLITGASGGIGKELAILFAKDGFNLVLVARSKENLMKVKNEIESFSDGSIQIYSKDLSKEDEIIALQNELSSNNIQIDYLVNNAGFGLFGEFVNTSLDEELNMIDLNIRTVTHLTKLFLKGMVERNKGGVMNIASTAAFQPGPLMSVYYATKAYVLSFSEALSNEMKGTNVKITAVCPGATETNFGNRASMNESKLFQSGVGNVKDVARIAYEGFNKGKTIVIPGTTNKVLANSVRFMPRKMVTSVVRYIQRRI
ncbi:SDR family NAD(P)-dependent oxidoreductase [Gottfriedia luciferensis]|uniref:SDR family NAD(P)-dependent oxidoreductase n=1 Tax=Gottfriedia luciferensis TaxID=178774 RepID=UPI000B453E7B|nr:SDR family oxidoreductase [Gottfriedia luciferensis]